jgi:hypothetical protein
MSCLMFVRDGSNSNLTILDNKIIWNSKTLVKITYHIAVIKIKQFIY